MCNLSSHESGVAGTSHKMAYNGKCPVMSASQSLPYSICRSLMSPKKETLCNYREQNSIGVNVTRLDYPTSIFQLDL